MRNTSKPCPRVDCGLATARIAPRQLRASAAHTRTPRPYAISREFGAGDQSYREPHSEGSRRGQYQVGIGSDQCVGCFGESDAASTDREANPPLLGQTAGTSGAPSDLRATRPDCLRAIFVGVIRSGLLNRPDEDLDFGIFR